MGRTGNVRWVCAGTSAALLLLLAGPIAAQSSPSGDTATRESDDAGFYAQLGVDVGAINFDHSSSNASGGVSVTGGYPVLPWLAAEGNFTYMGGGDVERHGDNVGNAGFYAFTLGAKIHPLSFSKAGFERDLGSAQPYASIGIGGGRFDAGDSEIDAEGSFVARFLFGFDIWATDHVGFFVEGGGYAASEEDVEGVGLLTFGAQYRF